MRTWILAAVALGWYAAAHASPVVFWVSQPVQPGDTALVFGSGLGTTRLVKIWRLADGPVKNPSAQVRLPGSGLALRPVQLDDRAAKFILPPHWKNGVFVARLLTPGGSTDVWINRPAILWAQGDAGLTSTPGGWVRVFGTSLGLKRPRIFLAAAGRAVLLDATPLSPLAVQAQIPATLAPGRYRLYVHNGCGGSQGWSMPVVFAVEAAHSPSSRLVRMRPSEWSDNDADRTQSLQSALDELGRKGGGTLLLARGRYRLSAGLSIPPGVTLAGSAMADTALCWPDSDNPPEALIRGTGNFCVRDLTLYATNHLHGIVADQTGPNAGNVRILRVRMRLDPYRGHLTPEEVNRRFTASLKLSTGGGDSLRLGGSNVVVAYCDIDGGGRCLYLSRGQGVWIHHNTFYNGRWGWYCISGSNGVIFENNAILGGDLMSTGGGLNCLDGSMVSQNVYYARNHLARMYGWDREAMTTDAGGAAYYGRIADAQGEQLELAADPQWGGREWKGAAVFILGGRGMGQYRQIQSAHGRTVTLDEPWLVPPDASSIVTITMLQRNYLFVDNTFQDAGIAIQMYGTAVGNIAYGNTSARTGGFHNFGMNYMGVQPSWFVQWLYNRITEGNVYGGGHDQSMQMGEAHLGVFALPPGMEPQAPVTLCGIIRGNRLDRNAHLAAGGADPPSPGTTFPYTQEVIVEGNTVRHASVGLTVSRAAIGILARNNTFVDCSIPVSDEQADERRAAQMIARFIRERKPVLEWRVARGDRRAVSQVPDVSGHGFDAVAAGTLDVHADDPEHPCLAFDGRTYLTVPMARILRLPSFTLSLWVKPHRLRGRYGLVAKRFNGVAAPFILGLTDGHPSFEATDADGRWSFNFISPVTLAADKWARLTLVFRAGEGAALYVDGRAAGSIHNANGVMQNEEPLCIGRDAWGGDPPKGDTPGIFCGCIADVVLWPEARELGTEGQAGAH
ncbi:MAG: LamG-like jellyroll fold domain-containing protein [Chthonomonadales bacterium]